MTKTYTIKPIRAYFTRRGYAVEIFDEAGAPYAPWLPVQGYRNRYMPCPMPATFFGDDGRKVRAEAIAWAKELTK